MQTKPATHWQPYAATVVFFVLVCLVPQSGVARESLVVEVCEIPGRFVFDQDMSGVPEPANDDGSPAYGNEFITQGLIFPEGTLTAGQACATSDGEAVPELADLVIGVWTCRGWHVGDGALTETGPSVITTQNFDFYFSDAYVPGKHMVVTDGFELADFDVRVTRPIVGTSGRHFKKLHNRESIQTLFDFFPFPITPDSGVKIRVEFPVKIRLDDDEGKGN